MLSLTNATEDLNCPATGEPRSLLFGTPEAKWSFQEDVEIVTSYQHDTDAVLLGTPTPAPVIENLAAMSHDDHSSGQVPKDSWDLSLAHEARQRLPYIVDQEGLQSSPEFNAFLRSKPPGYLDQVQHRLGVYLQLRKVDPSGFRKLWDDPDLQEHDCVGVPAPLAALEHLLSMVITVVCLTAWIHAGQAGPLVGWVTLQMAAWLWSRPSAIGWLMGITSVVSTDWPGHDQLAGPWRLMVANILDLSHVLATFGLGLATSLMMRCFARRQSVAEALLGIRSIREVKRPVKYSQYWEPPSN